MTVENVHDAWKKEKVDRFKSVVEFRELVQQVCQHLPGRWRYDKASNERSDRWVRLLGAVEGLALLFRCDFYSNTRGKGRVAISGDYPPDAYRQGLLRDAPKAITVALSRGPEKIAAEVQRRVLPDYLDRFEKVKNQVDAQHKLAETNRAAARHIAKALHDDFRDSGSSSDSYHQFSATGWESRGFTNRIVIESWPHSNEDGTTTIKCNFTVDDISVEDALLLADRYRVEGYVEPPMPVCGGCGKEMGRRDTWCRACDWEPPEPETCDDCGLPVEKCDCDTAPCQVCGESGGHDPDCAAAEGAAEMESGYELEVES